jgi:hypothetical protein
MGANAVTTVPVYVAGEVLTAADLNITNSGIPVFETSVERDAAFDGTGEKTLAEGQFAFLEDSNSTQFYDGASWQPVGVAPGLVLISSTTIGTTVANVTVTGAFSSTYDNYKITVSGGVASTGVNLQLQLGSTTTGYYSVSHQIYYSNATTEYASQNNGSMFQSFGVGTTTTLQANCEVGQPNLAKNTTISAPITSVSTGGVGGMHAGYLNDTTQYTSFLIKPNTGTLTGGTIRVYGYANS